MSHGLAEVLGWEYQFPLHAEGGVWSMMNAAFPHGEDWMMLRRVKLFTKVPRMWRRFRVSRVGSVFRVPAVWYGSATPHFDGTCIDPSQR